MEIVTAVASVLASFALVFYAAKQASTMHKSEAHRRREREEDRRLAEERNLRSLQILVGHLLGQVDIIRSAIQDDLVYKGLRATELPMMSREISDLLSLAREIPSVDLESAHRAATALERIAGYAGRVQDGAPGDVPGEQIRALPREISAVKIALTNLLAVQ